jgi:hypothetical protein
MGIIGMWSYIAKVTAFHWLQSNPIIISGLKIKSTKDDNQMSKTSHIPKSWKFLRPNSENREILEILSSFLEEWISFAIWERLLNLENNHVEGQGRLEDNETNEFD